MTLASRSAGIVEVVCSTGIVAPGLSLSLDLPGVQSMKYSPISDCGRDSQVASVAQRAEALLGELEVDERAVALLVEPQLGDRARADAGDLDVAALDEPERVVELDGELRAALLLRAGRRERVGARAGEDEDDDEGAPHLPGSTCDGSQGKSGVGL